MVGIRECLWVLKSQGIFMGTSKFDEPLLEWRKTFTKTLYFQMLPSETTWLVTCSF
ncbi:unnamed protein product [Protopolystoma xenopodis]|uniref:Uncharacterized protein n=1 Tax=Protopolystoma xenopodis TaxID=117903 RepID=A0A3S5C5D3_9PLAT|nr:unnamed protein product [Protopolystoma xenopodis]